MEQLVLLLLLALISIVNWLIQRSVELRRKRKLEADARRGDQPDAEPITEAADPIAKAADPPGAEADPAESMRKLMEALGLPVEETPPPIPEPRRQAPPPVPEVEEFASLETAPLRPRQAHPPPPIPHLPSRTKKPQPPPQQRGPQRRFREILASPSGLRDAVILSEILGKPRSLR